MSRRRPNRMRRCRSATSGWSPCHFRRLLTTSCALLGASCAIPGAASPIDARLASAVETGNIPGVVAVAATSDGITYEGAAGARDIETSTSMTVDTITRIASLTKAVTSAAVMQLVEQGRVSLDAPLAAYMPNFADTMVLDGFLADGTPILRKPESAVTIRQLLTHTSGYVYEIWNNVATRYAASGFVASIYDGGDGFLGAPLLSDPGTKWEYGISTDILGALVEVVSGQSLDGYLRENIFAPLNMPDT